jgi:hypothetical protein
VTTSARRGTRAWQVALAVAVAVNLVILFWPRPASPGGLPGLDKMVHLATFGSVALTGLRAGLPARWLLPVLAAHAVASEVVQELLLSRRSGDLRDVVADLVGVLAGTLLARASWGSDGSGAGDDPDRAPAGGDTRPG